MLSGKYNLNPLDARSILVFPGQAHHCAWFSIFEIILKAEFPLSVFAEVLCGFLSIQYLLDRRQ
jgi:hypothetical protein